MPTIESMMQSIQNIINLPIPNLAGLLNDYEGTRVFDAVEKYLHANPDKRLSFYSPPIGTKIADIVHRRLGHIVLSPYDSSTTKALTDSYVYKYNDTRVDSRYVNISPRSTQNYIDQIVAVSHRLREAALDKDAIDSEGRRIASIPYQAGILCGSRGIGKTFFLNHLASKYFDTFDAKKIIWTRINFLNDYSSHIDEHTILEWLYAQLAKIIFRYYDPNSIRYDKSKDHHIDIDAFEVLNTYIHKDVRDHELKMSYKDKLQGLVDVFQKSERMEALTKGFVPINLGRILYNHLLHKGLGIVFVLDSLDKMEALTYQQFPAPL